MQVLVDLHFFLFYDIINYVGKSTTFGGLNMVILFKNIKKPRILVFDAEYNEGDLIQFSGILFKRVDENDLYQIEKSLTIYTKLEENQTINPFIQRFTGISDYILEREGVPLEEGQKTIMEFVNYPDIAVVSQGVSNDRQILYENGINFYENEFGHIEGICTFEMAKRIFERDKNLSLRDLAQEAGLYLSNQHNAYYDALINAAVLSFLTKIDKEGRK